MAKTLYPRGERGKAYGASFAGGRLTFLKLGSASAGFGGCVWNFFFESQGNQILGFQGDREF